MSNKTIRYIAIMLGVITTLIVTFSADSSYIRSGMFDSEVERTLLYNILKDIIKAFGAYTSTSKKWAYFLWFIFLIGGLYSAWRFRFKTASIITKISKSIHEKT